MFFFLSWKHLCQAIALEKWEWHCKNWIQALLGSTCFLVCLHFWEKVSIQSPVWPLTHGYSPASVSQMLWLQVCTTRPAESTFLFFVSSSLDRPGISCVVSLDVLTSYLYLLCAGLTGMLHHVKLEAAFEMRKLNKQRNLCVSKTIFLKMVSYLKGHEKPYYWDVKEEKDGAGSTGDVT